MGGLPKSTIPAEKDLPSVSAAATLEEFEASNKRALPVSAIVGVMAICQAVVLSVLIIRQHRSFGTYGYDLGLYSQAAWLVSRHGLRQAVFLSSRGLPLWGHHANPILILLAPLSRFGGGALGLAITQNVAVASGAFPVAWLTKSRTASGRAALLMAAMYLIYPPNAWFAQVSFHPEILSVPLMLYVGWFAHNRKHTLMWVAMFLALGCREEVGLVIGVFGIFLMIRAFRARDRKRILMGFLVAVISFLWFVICTRIIIPNALGTDPFYVATFYGKYGNSYGQVAKNLLTKPDLAMGLATEQSTVSFVVDLFGPFAFLPLLGVPTLMSGVPLLGLLLSSNDQAHTIQSHYPALLVPGIVLGAIESMAWIWRSQKMRVPAAVLLALASVTFAFVRSPLPGSANAGQWKSSEPSRAALDRAISLIPVNANVSAQTNIVPHLTQREVLYQFPNPFNRWFYGQFALEDPSGAHAPQAEYPFQVDWLIVKPADTGRFHPVIDRLLSSGEFVPVFEQDGVLLARRKGSR
jgi:uncharacterized membrane protein